MCDPHENMLVPRQLSFLRTGQFSAFKELNHSDLASIITGQSLAHCEASVALRASVACLENLIWFLRLYHRRARRRVLPTTEQLCFEIHHDCTIRDASHSHATARHGTYSQPWKPYLLSLDRATYKP